MAMITYHIYKADCYKASRVILQAGWDESTVFLHYGHESGVDHHDIISEKLNFWTVFRKITSQGRDECALVFHAQSSLSYLLFSRALTSLYRKRNVHLVYDMHDLLENKKFDNIWHYIRYGVIRGTLLGMLEKIVFSDAEIKKITVSKGLAHTVSKKYGIHPPDVVRSAPNPTPHTERDLKKDRDVNALLFFGTLERVPFGLIDRLADCGLELHLYGRGITIQSLVNCRKSALPSNVKIFGEYSPRKLEFIGNYKYLLLYVPHDKSANFRYSLPNKLFQAMNAGLSLVVSSNFEEIIATLDCIPGAVYVMNEDDSILDAIHDIDQKRRSDFVQNMHDYCNELHRESKIAYRNALGLGTKQPPSRRRWVRITD